MKLTKKEILEFIELSNTEADKILWLKLLKLK